MVGQARDKHQAPTNGLLNQDRDRVWGLTHRRAIQE